MYSGKKHPSLLIADFLGDTGGGPPRVLHLLPGNGGKLPLVAVRDR